MNNRRSRAALLSACVLVILVYACDWSPVTVTESSQSSSLGDRPPPPNRRGGRSICPCCQNPGEHGDECILPPITVSVCRDIWQEKNDDGVCVCKYDWMEKDEDGWCRNRDRPDDSGGTGGGNTGEGSEGDSITFIVRIDCRTALVRGQTVTCAAETRNGVGDITYEWEYEPDGGGAHIWDRGRTHEPLDPVDATTSSNIWEGTAVHGGVVSVKATDEDGNHDTAETDFTVSARGWNSTKASVINSKFRRGPDITQPIYYNADLGLNVSATNLSYYFDDVLEGDSNSTGGTKARIAGVTAGPNEGYGYVASHAYKVDRRYQINERLERTGPVEIPDTIQYSDTVNHWTYMSRRTGWNPAAILNGVIAHETYGRGSLKGHQGQIERAATVAACGDAATLADRIVANSRDRANRLRGEVELAAQYAFREAADHHRVYGLVSDSIVYWASGIAPIHTFYADIQGAPPTTRSRPECDWSYF